MKNLLTLIGFLIFNLTAISQINWEHTGGPNGGATWHIYNNDQYVFYADEYYLYRSADGVNWEKLPESALWPIATHGSTLVAQHWQGNSYSYLGQPQLKISHDNGETWSEINWAPGVYSSSRMALCSHGIYITRGQDHLILRSPDEGITWDTMFPPIQFGYDVWQFDDRLYLRGGANEVWRTDSNGENWESVTPPLGQTEYIREIFAHSSHILVSTVNKLWHSNDNGQTWAFRLTPHPYQYDGFALAGNTLFALGDSTGIAKSEDFGGTWTLLPLDNDDYNPTLLGIASVAGQMLGASYNQGVIRWDETSQKLVESNQGVGSAAIYDLAAKGGDIWAATGNGIFKFNEQQQAWTTNSLLPIANYQYQNIEVGDNGLVCASNLYDYNMFLSTDYGLTWDTITGEDISTNGFFSFDEIIILDNIIFISSESDGQYRSDDLGQTWQPLTIPFYLYHSNLFKFNGQWITYNGNQIYTSNNQGISWSALPDFPIGGLFSLHPVGDWLMAITLILNNPPFFQSTNKLYISQDGINWIYAHDGLPMGQFGGDYFQESQAYFFEHEGKYFAYDGQYGMFSSNDTCQSWFPVDIKHYHNFIKKDSILYGGGFGGGVIRTVIPDNLYGELMQGTVFMDDNNNGLKETGEDPMSNIPVSISAPYFWYPFYYTTTDDNGEYAIGVTPNLLDTLRPILHSPYIENINPPFYIANGTGIKDFGVHLTPNIIDYSLGGGFIGRPRPGFDYWLYLRVKNDGTIIPNAATASIQLDPTLVHLSSTPSPTGVFGDSLVWELAQVPVFNSEYITVKTNVPASTPLGQLLETSCRVAPLGTDETLANNHLILTDTVVGSYDPNEKRVQPADGLSEAEIAAGKELLFTIHFQNTGTFPAERVRITDLLDTALYLPSVRLVATSHLVTTFQLKPGGLLEVLFDNIQLPDSTSNEPASHGFVTFAVQRNKAFGNTFPVRNSAAIYFDFNEPILTNEVSFYVRPNDVSGTIEPRPKRHATDLLIFPNPTAGSFTVSSKGRLSGQGSLHIQNAFGQILMEQKVMDLSNPIQVKTEELPEGIFFVKLSGRNGAMSGKVVLQFSQ